MPERTQALNQQPVRPGPVIYWMNRDQRAEDNWALLTAQRQACLWQQPLVVVFCLQEQYQGATARHFAFMLRSLRQVAATLADYQIVCLLSKGEPAAILAGLCRDLAAGLVVTDFSPLRLPRTWRRQVAEACPAAVLEVDAHNIIPVWETSPKLEFAARTIRPKIQRQLAAWLEPFPELVRQPVGLDETQLTTLTRWGAATLSAWDAWLAGLAIWTSPQSAAWPRPGSISAQARLAAFLADGLDRYPTRNDPNQPVTSGLSPWLHFGQLAPQRAALAVSAWAARPERSSLEQQSAGEFLEELIVRRELADNFCYYNPLYDQLAGFPVWARQTLDRHRGDPRPFCYRPEQLEAGETGDPLWNAAQQTLVCEGVLAGYLRMYWAKKLLEWTPDPETAQALAIQFNDTYLFDGRDPNGYTGIAWSIGGVHDRPWGERPVFGMIRSMTYQGCRRKFDVDAWIAGQCLNRS